MLKAKHIIILFTSWAFNGNAQISPKVKITGGARSIINNQNIQVNDSIPDKTTPKGNAGGYALIDLGFNISPNKNTEILGMIRIKNQYGGFFGGGVSFDVRQLWVKGIIADAVRYQLGDINLKQTPFTFYNNNEDLLINQNPVTKMQQEIVNYETFYKNNTWRQQGASIDFGLNFSKYLQEINVNGYLTRLNMTNFGNVPERLFGGSTVDFIVNDHLSAQYNLSSVFDVTGTGTDSNSFRNIVQTGAFKYANTFKNYPIVLKGEFGNSSMYYTVDPKAPKLNDFFLNPSAQISFPKLNIDLELGYLNVGPDFRSPGAQSKRINYNSALTSFGLYKQTQADRPVSLGDIMGDNKLYNNGISNKIMAYHPLINNVLPYGLATFNRNGAYGIAKWSNKEKGLSADWAHYQLSEIRGQGTKNLKKYTMSNLQLGWNLSKVLKLKKSLKISTAVSYQQTSRTGEFSYEKVDLQSIQSAFGFEWEFAKQLELVGGYTGLQGKGHDQMSSRNFYTEVTDFKDYNVNLSESITAVGLRFRFTEKAYFGIMYQSFNYDNKAQAFDNYKINQTLIIYNLLF